MREKARNRELSDDKKINIKRGYGRNRYHNMSAEDKQKLKEYQEIIVSRKNQHNFFICIFLHCIKMRKELIFNNEHSNYRIGKYHMQKDKKQLISI